MICCMYFFPLGGSARKSRVLPAMITKLVEKDLLYVFCYMRGFCQKDKGSASHDPQVSRKGSAVCVVLHEGVLPERLGFC